MPHVVTQQAAYQSAPIDVLSTGPTGEFAVPTNEDAPYSDSPVAAWASPSYRMDEIPNAPVEFRPNGANPPNEFFRQRDEDTRSRESITSLDADGFDTEVRISAGERRWMPDPKSVPAVEARLTQRLSPSSWRFLRPFDQGYARELNGNHFSMADHRRDYEIGGMAPAASRRNTYRLEPSPWDANNVDMPPDVEPDVPSARIIAIDLPPARNTAWRL